MKKINWKKIRKSPWFISSVFFLLGSSAIRIFFKEIFNKLIKIITTILTIQISAWMLIPFGIFLFLIIYFIINRKIKNIQLHLAQLNLTNAIKGITGSTKSNNIEKENPKHLTKQPEWVKKYKKDKIGNAKWKWDYSYNFKIKKFEIVQLDPYCVNCNTKLNKVSFNTYKCPHPNCSKKTNLEIGNSQLNGMKNVIERNIEKKWDK